MAIPKKIHYVWVGGKEKPKDIKICMKKPKSLGISFAFRPF
jgi:mannosyltransferase OCH1-like enzyme